MPPSAPAKSALPRAILASALFLTLAAAIPLLAAAFAPAEARIGEALAVWLIVAYSAFRLGQLALRGEARILSLTFWVFVYIWLGIAPFTQLMNDAFPLPGHYTASDTLACAALVGVGLVGFEVGFQWSQRVPRRANLVTRVLGRSISTTRVIILAVLAVCVSSYLVLRLGGPSAFIASRQDVFFTVASATGTESQEALQLLSKLLRVPPFVALFLLWLTWTRQRRGRGRHQTLWIAILLAATLAVNALVNNPLNSARYWFGTIALSFAFVSIPWRKGWSFAVSAALLVGMMIVVFPYADVFRRDIDVSNLYFEGLDPVLNEGHYDAFQQAMNATIYVGEERPLYGRQMAGALLFWVPRRIWDDKPLPSGRLVAQFHGYPFSNVSMPLWGEAYLDGGFLFAGVVLMFYGVFLGTLERRFVERASHSRGAPDLLDVVVPILAAYQIFLLRGALMNSVAYLVPVLMLLLIVSEPSEERSAEAAASPRRSSEP